MENKKNPLEVWMRGQLPDILPVLQPAAHALLQVMEDVNYHLTPDLNDVIWEKPVGMACIAFHVQHIAGVVDRMFTYANKESLTENQFEYLKNESIFQEHIDVHYLKTLLNNQIGKAIQQLKTIKEHEVTEVRYLGRKQIPTTLIGLVFHAAEHAQRHFGQLLVTIAILKNKINQLQ